ncbi:diacylglycerol O-acyltransferase 1-like [Oppia nitens]|uniref:diacylglycerol O-acyltransferase 1-like n=1 Tax=Oppia nitens TaxID=1686743 RepID=UPI0023DCB393|nr:diacylglycerol O-acyltransferase 1-like [Oppia nitens]
MNSKNYFIYNNNNNNINLTNNNNNVYLRRTNSVTRLSEIKDLEKKSRREQADQPVHEPKDSLFSSSSGYTNYRGLLNLCIILLVLSNARVALENIIKYGILVDPVQWIKIFIGKPNAWPSCQLILSVNIFILISFVLEHIFATKLWRERTGRILVMLNIATILSLPPIVINSVHCNPIGASIACGLYSIISLKLVSYHMVNYWCRKHKLCTKKLSNAGPHTRRRSFSSKEIQKLHQNGSTNNDSKHPLVEYPNNLNLVDLYYYMFAPTLCYELNFPRSERIRKRFLIKRILEILFLLQLNLGLIQQWMVPTISNSFKPLQEMNFTKMLERLLKLAIPNHIIWLIFFYWFFHSCLNTIAEILRFSDREFYRDWWNAESVNYFWQNWNIPVHKWCVRHLYKPLIAKGVNKFHASVLVFLLSAFFHEYLVSVPLSMFRLWAFFGMLSQIPFSMFVSKYLNNQTANIAVWISLIIGQPLCILMYYHDYYVIHHVNKNK